MDILAEEAGGPIERESTLELDQPPQQINRKLDLDRVYITPVPKYFGFKQFKKLLEKYLNGIEIKKIRQMKFDAYVSFASPEDASKALEILNGLKVKKTVLIAKLAETDERKERTQNSEDFQPKTARESVTPLANVPYEEQLQIKNKLSLKLVDKLLGDMRKANVLGSSQLRASELLKEIKPSPKTTAYRNKCEFTVGMTLDGEVCVGFVGGRYSKNQHYVIPVDEVDNITQHMKNIVKAFTQFVRDSGLPPMDEFARCGVWKMLTVREFGGDVMLIITVYPLDNVEKEVELKKSLCERFLSMSTFHNSGFRVTSLFWQVLANCSDAVEYQHIGGAPYIYETVLDCRFRVSPSAFFQTNSQAASSLYTTIGISCGLDSEPSSEEVNKDEYTGEIKKARLESCTDIQKEETDQANQTLNACISTIFLDICCGTGTIGQCLIKQYNKTSKVCCIGIEMIPSAVEDAKQNAKDNGMGDNICRYIAGKAEDVFPSLRYYLPSGFELSSSRVVGILDPPRPGIHEKVILGCRQMSALRRLVFVSCDPSAALKNIVDLCRPMSKKYAGESFRLLSIQPVDMFPQTHHVEWVVTMQR